MNSREKILTAIAENQPLSSEAVLNLSDQFLKIEDEVRDHSIVFGQCLTAIGGSLIPVNSYEGIVSYIRINTREGDRVISTIPDLFEVAEPIFINPSESSNSPHSLEDIDLAIVEAHFGVAENGAVWITEDLIKIRVLPFICQHFAVVLMKENIVSTMHDAYQKIGSDKYGFGTFIAGPSKTADIEQSLVLGAHGARTMTVFLLNNSSK